MLNPRVDGRSAVGVVGVNTRGYYVGADGQECALGSDACDRHLGGPQLTAAINGPLYAKAEWV